MPVTNPPTLPVKIYHAVHVMGYDEDRGGGKETEITDAYNDHGLMNDYDQNCDRRFLFGLVVEHSSSQVIRTIYISTRSVHLQVTEEKQIFRHEGGEGKIWEPAKCEQHSLTQNGHRCWSHSPGVIKS